jgi:hypothetical protein
MHEWLVSSDQELLSTFVSRANRFKENALFRLISRDLGNIIKDNRVIRGELGDCL